MSSYPSGYGQGHEYSEQDVIDAGGSADIARESLFGYTPTMSDVREVFINNSLSFNGVDFDAMLTAHDAEVARKAVKSELAELADLLEPFSGIGLSNGATRAEIAAWLRDRAEQIGEN